jgi:hypothetical protein
MFIFNFTIGIPFMNDDVPSVLLPKNGIIQICDNQYNTVDSFEVFIHLITIAGLRE